MDATTTSKTVPTAQEQKKQDGRVDKFTKQDASLSEQMTSLSGNDASLSKQITSLSKPDDSLSEQITSLSRKDTSLSEKPTDLNEKPTGLSGKDASLSEQDGGSSELTHDELMEVTSTALNDLLKSVTILADLPQDVTLEEVNAQIAVQHGQSITVYAVREDGEEIAAVVNQKGAKVIDLKHAIRRAVDLKVKRAGKSGEKRKISWKYVWKTNQLCFEGERLTSDQALLADLGVRNKARVTFVKRLREKGTVVR